MKQEIFQQKLRDLVILANQNKKQLHRKVAEQFFQEEGLSPRQLELVYEYLRSQGIQVIEAPEGQAGGDHAAASGDTPKDFPAAVSGEASKYPCKTASAGTMDDFCAEASDNSESPEEEESLSLSPQDRQTLEEYRARFSAMSPAGPEEFSRLFAAVRQGDALAKQRLAELYLPAVVELSCAAPGPSALQDKIQEGSLGLWMALEAGLPQEGEEEYLRSAVKDAIRQLLALEDSQRRQDGYLVERVRSLDAKVREFAGEDDGKYSVEELSAFLDMEAEEIQAILKLTGED